MQKELVDLADLIKNGLCNMDSGFPVDISADQFTRGKQRSRWSSYINIESFNRFNDEALASTGY